MQNKGNFVTILLAALLSLAALALYTATLSQGPCPGGSAEMMATELGLNPIAFGHHPLFSALVKIAAELPMGTISARLNVLSAICAAAALWLFFGLVRNAILYAIDVTDLNRRAAEGAATLAAVAATVALGLCSPFWFAANRFHVAAFDLLLLFALARLFMSFVNDVALWKGALFAFAYGILAVEFATAIVFGPLVLAGILAALWHHGELRSSRVLVLGGCLALGMLFYLAAAWRLASSTAFELNDSGGLLWQALYFYLKTQFNLIARSLPQVGWLLVVVTSVIPWLAALALGRRSLNEEKDKGLYILHGILTAIVLAVLFNAPFVPWRLMGESQLLVTPYALLAATYGYLVAYWFLLPRMFALDAEPEERGRVWFRENGGWIPAVALILLALVAGLLHFRESDARSAGAVNAYARAVVETATEVVGGSRNATGASERFSSDPWIVTEGVLDNHLLIAAAEMRRPLHLFNLRMLNNVPYLKGVARSFQDVRLKSLAGLDGMAFLRTWMADDPDFGAKTVFQIMPDLLISAGFQPVPCRMLHRGVRALTDVDPESLWQTHQVFWKSDAVKELKAVKSMNTTTGWQAGYLLRQASLTANNLGVVMEDVGWRQQAYEAYRKAREMDEGNISALMNMGIMIDQGYAASDAPEVKSGLSNVVSGLKQKLQIWDLARTFGYVRLPQAYADMGMTWALSGQPGMAVAGFKRAIELDPSRKAQLSQGLATAYMAQSPAAAESEALYRQMLDENPSNRVALVTLARMAASRGRFEEATNLLARAEQAGTPRAAIAQEYAVLHLAKGDAAKARVILEGVTDLQPDSLHAWALLASVGLLQKDDDLIIRCAKKLERAKTPDYFALAVLADIAFYRSDYASARSYLDQALSLRPSMLPLLDQLLRLDYQERRRDLATVHIKAILLKDPGHAFANQLLGTFQAEREEYDLAEDSLRRALERGKTSSLLNDLAWALQGQGKLAEAERSAREALAMSQDNAAAWDTLGVILMKQNKLSDAEEALLKAKSLVPDYTSAQLHLAELYAEKGEREKAVKMAEELLNRESGLTDKERRTLRNVARGK